MKKLTLSLALLFALPTFAQVKVSDVKVSSVKVSPLVPLAGSFFAQTGIGAGNGSSCANAAALPVPVWTPGTTYTLCGTITSTITVGASGTSSNPITILFNSGANMSSATGWPNTGALNLNSQSYIIVNGGTNGIIQNTLNGSTGGSCTAGACVEQVADSLGVNAKGTTNCTIENLSIIDMYVHSSTSDTFPSTANSAVAYYNPPATNLTVQNNTVHDVAWALNGYGNGLTVSGNTIYNVDHGIAILPGTGTWTGMTVKANTIHDFSNWDTTSNTYHHDGVHVSAIVSGEIVSGLNQYGNYIYGNFGSNYTAATYWQGEINSSNLFNELVVQGIGSVGDSNGLLDIYNVGFSLTATGNQVYNNTVIGLATLGNPGLCVALAGQSSISYKNNLLTGCYTLLSLSSSTTFASGGLNNNVYEDVNTDYGYTHGLCWNGASNCTSSLATWQSNSGGDGSAVLSTLSALNLSSSYVPQLGSTAIGAAANLTFLGITALDSDFNGTARPATGGWDAGAFVGNTTTTGLPQDQLPTGTGWHDLGTGTKLITSGACTSGIGGTDPCGAIIQVWSGMAADWNDGYALGFGGGHNDSCNNQVLALNLTGSSGWTWTGLTAATTPSCAGSYNGDCLPDTLSSCPTIGNTGFPVAVHSYSANVWDPYRGNMYTGSGIKSPNPNTSTTAWKFNVSSSTWTVISNSGAGFLGSCSGATSQGTGGIGGYDAFTDKYIFNGPGCLYQIDPATNTLTQLTFNDTSFLIYDMDGVIDPIRHKFYYVGDSGDCSGAYYCGMVYDDITPGSSYARTNVTSTMTANGCSAIAASHYPSLTYDPVTTLILGAEQDITQGIWWINFSSQAVVTAQGTVNAQSCLSITGLGTGPPVNDGYPGGGLASVSGHGHLQYQMFCDCFAYINSPDQDAWVLRLPRLASDLQQFNARAAGPNVKRAIAMNTTAALTNGGVGTYEGYSNDAASGNAPVLDTLTPGSSGDIKFTVPVNGNANAPGSVTYFFGPGPTYSNQFGAPGCSSPCVGQEFWLSYRINFDQYYAQHTYPVIGGGNVSPKIAIMGDGQEVTNTGKVSSCTNLEQDIQPAVNLGTNQAPNTYSTCGTYLGKTPAFGGSNFLMEPGINSACNYSGSYNCFNYQNHYGKWVNVLMHVKVNSWSGVNTKGTSNIDFYMGDEGGPLNIISSTADEGFQPDNDTTDPNGSNLFGAIWFLAYMTNRDSTVAAAQATSIRYDKFMVSSSGIPVDGPIPAIPGMIPPTVLSTSVSGTHVVVTWNHNDLVGYDTYLLERCSDVQQNCWSNPTANFTQIATVGSAAANCTNLSACTYTDTTTSHGTTYTYRVRAKKVLFGQTYYSEYSGGTCYISPEATCPTSATP